MRRVGQFRGLVQACHPGPTVAVTALAALLCVRGGHGLGSGALVTGAVFAGQLSIGWSNDLLDAARDAVAGRADKPVARGEVSPGVVRVALGLAGAVSIVLSLACGIASGVVHLGLVVGAGWAYNLGLKATPWSAIPYAVAFGSLPAVVWLAHPLLQTPPAWMVLTGALLGVGAHLLNAIPDLADDAATGVRGLPHRLGERRSRLVAVFMLSAGFVVAAAAGGGPWWLMVTGGLLVAALGVVAVLSRGRAPFRAAIGIALVTVAVLVWPRS